MRGFLYTLMCIGICVGFPILTNAQLSANFGADVTSGCSPIVVNFTDSSTGSPTSWSWDLGNGTTSTLENPSTTYITAGTYTVKLTVKKGTSSSTVTKTSYITVLASPTVSFIASDSAASCPPMSITFTNSSTAGTGTETYLWDFGDGTSATTKSPSHTYTTPGKYDVSLVVTNSSGCNKTLTKTRYIDMESKPTASFTSSNANTCTAPATVNFTNTSTGSATSYSWDFGDGSSSTSTSPSHRYTSTGTYTVKLIATNSTGCSDTLVSTDFVNIGNLKASFTIDTPVCTGAPLSFTNTSVPSSATSSWSFGDGTTSTASNPTHNYSSSGSYTVRLIEGLSGCADTTTTSFTVHPSAVVKFSTDSISSCKIPFSVPFKDSTTGASSYKWYFGDGSTSTATSPTHSYTANGDYTVTLIATTSLGCKDSLVRTNLVAITPANYPITANPSGGCVGISVNFTTTATSSALSSYKWNFGDGTTSTTSLSPSHTYSTAGTYRVVFSYTTKGGCIDSNTVSVTINTKPTASFTDSNGTICPLNIVYFKNTSTGTATSYTWIFGDGAVISANSPTHEYGIPGTYTVTLIAKNGNCSDTAKKTNIVTVYPPTVGISYKVDCSNRLKVTFTNLSVGDSTSLWTFGDGDSSTATNPTHTYASYGNDTVSLYITDTKYSCKNSHAIPIVLIPSTVNFTANDTTVCKNTPVDFRPVLNTSLYTAYNWSFGPSGATSTNDTATYTYTAPGFYTVKLSATDINGCTDTMTKRNYIEVGGPLVAFSATPLTACPVTNVSFTDASTDGGIKITNRNWTFGDGGTNTGDNTTPSHTYSSAGTYDVKLVVIDTLGCKDSLTKSTYINITKPTALFSTNDTTLCPGQTAHFTNNSDSAVSYSWSFGDGGTSTATSPTHIYTTGGTYTVTLVAKNANGCTDTFTHTSYIKVNKLAAGFTMNDSTATCPPLSVNFTNTSTGATSYSWTFGNGNTSSLTNPTTVYSKSDTYTIKLVAKNSSGCADSTTDTVSVLGPKGTFSYSASATGCEPLSVTFTATDTNATSLTWDMNNGFTHTTTSSSYTYTYTSPGSYVPVLVLGDGSKCNVAIQGMDTIKVDGIKADFTFSPDSICTPALINFVDTVDSTLSVVNTRRWSFGDGGTSTTHNPSHTYTTSGSYNVQLIIGNTTGCLDTVTKTVYINAAPTVSAGPNQSICPGGTSVKLVASGASSYRWFPSTGLSCTNCDSTFASPTATTTYSVIGTDAYGCIDTAKVTVTLYPKPNVTTDSSVQICSGTSTKLFASGASTYTWYPGTTLSCTSCDTTTATPISTTTYYVIGKNSNGCIDTANVTVNVNSLPNVVADSTQSICKGTSASLSASGASTYVWTPSTGLSCTSCTSPTASPATTTTYIVKGTDAHGCVDTSSLTITVNAGPTVSAGPNKSICTGSGTSLIATGATTYTWSPSTGLSCTSCDSTFADPTTTTTYTVIGSNGCLDTAKVTVTVHSLPTVTTDSALSICSGTSVKLIGHGASTYAWSPSTGLSCTSCDTTTATPSSTTTYYVTGTDINGCTDSAKAVVTVNPLPSVVADSTQSICKNTTVQLTASGASTYSWTPTSGLSCTTCSDPKASPASTTTYTVTGTDAKGCKDTGSVTITVNSLPVTSAGPNKNICIGSGVELIGTGAASYTWYPSSDLTCTACDSTFANPTTTTTYNLIGTNGTGCSDTTSVKIIVHALPTVTADSSQTICSGAAAHVIAHGALSYTWSPTSGLSCVTCPNPTITTSGTTTYIVTGVDSFGCTDTASLTITTIPLPDLTISPDQGICSGSSVELHVSGASSYKWSPATGLSCTTCDSTKASPTATTTYTVLGSNASGCSATGNVTVTVYQPPTITVSPSTTISLCSDSSVQLQAGGANTYEWSPATALSCTACATTTANPTNNITYVVVGTDIHGCVDSNKVSINVIQHNPVTVSANDTICQGVSAQLTATGGDDYVWLPATGLNNNLIPDPLATPEGTTTYIAIIKQGQCFIDTGSVTVVVNPIPTVKISANQSVTAGSSVVLLAEGTNIITFEWSPANTLSCSTCPNPTATPTQTTTYTVSVTSGAGCKASDKVTINVGCDNSQIFIPNTFTPNGDGVNDRFYVSGQGITTLSRFSVYDRWGELVYNAQNVPVNNPSVGWDGTYKGQPLKPDVFVYVIEATCETGQPLSYKGDISLVR